MIRSLPVSVGVNKDPYEYIDPLPAGKYKVVATGEQNGKSIRKEINVTF